MEPITSTEPTEALTTSRVVRTPGTCGGKPHIDGHRIKVEHIAVCYERLGMTPDEIVDEHPTITLSQVHAALAYYYEHRTEIDADIEEGQRFVAELKAKTPPSRAVNDRIAPLGTPIRRSAFPARDVDAKTCAQPDRKPL